MKLLLLTLALGLVGCGTMPNDGQLQRVAEEIVGPNPKCSIRTLARYHDPEFRPYLTAFQQDAKKYKVGCYSTSSMHFVTELEKDIAGYCLPGERIVISRQTWDNLQDIEKSTLIYHELGHCSLGLDHTAPNEWALMNPRLLPTYMLEGHWDELVEAMFQKAKKEQRK